jgi:hypothetical protein
MRQQPNGDANDPTPFVPLGTDVLVDPTAKPVRPEVPVAKAELPRTLEPAQTVAVLSGPGTLIIGLTPALPISVAPSGTVPPFSVDPAFAAGFASGDPIPVDDAVLGAEAQELDTIAVPDGKLPAATPVNPPPSKLELAPLVPEPVICDELVPIEEPIIELVPIGELIVATQLEPLPAIGRGLTPPGFISVAPSGIPAGDPAEVEPGIPSGDVAGRPGVAIVLCAEAMPQLNVIVARTSNKRFIETSSTPAVARRLLDRGCGSCSRDPPCNGNAGLSLSHSSKPWLRRPGHERDSAQASRRAGRQADSSRPDLVDAGRTRREWNAGLADPADGNRGRSRTGSNRADRGGRIDRGGLCESSCREADEQAGSSGDQLDVTKSHCISLSSCVSCVVPVSDDTVVAREHAVVDTSKGAEVASVGAAVCMRMERPHDVSRAEIWIVRLRKRRRSHSGGDCRRNDELPHKSSPMLRHPHVNAGALDVSRDERRAIKFGFSGLNSHLQSGASTSPIGTCAIQAAFARNQSRSSERSGIVACCRASSHMITARAG